jgi:hypothetical protein
MVAKASTLRRALRVFPFQRVTDIPRLKRERSGWRCIAYASVWENDALVLQ